jgi:hypothetical protein
VFDWARFRRTKGAVKLHLLLDHDGFLPCYAVITEGKQHEIGVARQLRYEPGTLLAIDRGYLDYGWFAALSEQGVYFVTRMKDNADYMVLEDRELPHRKGLLRDQVIGFYQQARDGQQCYFRRIEFYDEEQDRVLVFVTNHLTLAAATVAEVYKQRWQIELFLKALKQNLRVKTFLGTSANALKTQVWAALIAMLLIKYLQLKATFGWSLSNLVALLRQQLFVYRDLRAWIDHPPSQTAIKCAILPRQLKSDRPKYCGMQAQSDKPFVRCFNAGGVIESICMKCFLTVCRCRTEVGIEGREAKHVCQNYPIPGPAGILRGMPSASGANSVPAGFFVSVGERG